MLTATMRRLPLLAVVMLMAAPLTRADEAAYDARAAMTVHEWIRTITEIQMYDGFSPPKATRNFAAATIAAYQAALPGFPACRSLEGQVAGLRDLPRPDLTKPIDWRIAAAAAFHFVTKDLLYKDAAADSLLDAEIAALRATGLSEETIERSKQWGATMGAAVKAWYKNDGFVKIQASNTYVIPKYEGAWEATPPAFKEPADPFWAKFMRPLTLKGPDAIPATGPWPYSADSASDFYRAALEVYDVSRNLTDEQRIIALYWNDNPTTVVTRGHVEYMMAWMTPPAHWMSIAGQASRAKGQNMMEALETYALMAVAGYDAFLSCWHEKYRSNVIRPITYINRFIDKEWESFIQTPPFPEHTSGHSSVSGAASQMLTNLFGANVAFTDSTSVPLGFEPRTFPSFRAAGEEAAMSRLYGGIHYRRGNDAGLEQGRAIANHVFRNVRTRI